MNQATSFITFNLLTLSLLNSVTTSAIATEKQLEATPATTIEQWQSQLNNSLANITEIRTRSTPTGLEIDVVTDDGQTLQGIKSVEGNSLIIDFANSSFNPQLSEGIPDSTEGISGLAITTVNRTTVRLTISGEEGVPTGEIVRSDRGATIAVTSPQPATTEPVQVIDIIVTAEKKPEPIQDVPISITPITEEEAEDGDITTFRDIAENTPNFTTYTPSRNFVNYSVRGLSNFNFVTRDPVAFYVDDVPYDFVNFLGIEIYDIERVETLRGPQATLYGRNAQAGVVNIVTKQPADEFDLSGSIGYGNFDNFTTRATVSSPIVDDKLSFRLSGSYESRDGFTVLILN